jgi:hypothetical protein
MALQHTLTQNHESRRFGARRLVATKKSAAPAVRAAKKSRAAYAALVGMTDVCGLT